MPTLFAALDRHQEELGRWAAAAMSAGERVASQNTSSVRPSGRAGAEPREARSQSFEELFRLSRYAGRVGMMRQGVRLPGPRALQKGTTNSRRG